MLCLGFLATFVPTILFVEISQWLAYEQNLKRPFLKCVLTSSVLGITLATAMVMSAQGESGLAAMCVFPFIVGGFAAGGAVVGLIYKANGRTFLPERTRKKSD